MMDNELDHYAILGLPSGEDGANLSEKRIKKAFKKKAMETHPDKRPNDPKAKDEFVQVHASYAILKDEKARKSFDEIMRIKRRKALHQSQQSSKQALHQSQQSSKRRKMVADLEAREKAASAHDPKRKAREEEERITRKLHEEISRIRAQHANRFASTTPWRTENEAVGGREIKSGCGSRVDKAKVLKVKWEIFGGDYSAQRLKESFEKFGEVQDVVIKSSKERGSALVVMASKDAAVAAADCFCGDPSNPLLVLPLDPKKPEGPELSNPVGAARQSFQDLEDFVLKKMREKAAENQK